MHIDWAALAEVGAVASAAALTVVLLVALAVVGLSHPAGRSAGGRPRPSAGTAVAALCIGAAGLVVATGLYVIVA